MVRPLFTATLLLLLAAPLAEAQQTPAKTKVKTKRTAASATAAPSNSPAAPAEATLPAPPPGGPAGPAGPRPPHPGPGAPRAKGGAQALSNFSGTLTEYTAGNDEQVYDGFTLKTSAGTETVRFPRHLGRELMAAAKAGSNVSLTGFRDTDPEGRSALHLVSLTAGGQTVQATLPPPPPPTTPRTPEAASAQGTISRLDADPQGRTRAVLLNDGTILHLPPAAVEQLAEKLKVGARVAATGDLRPRPEGEVAIRPVRVLRTQTITLDGVQFLVR
ncbi:OB-fold nucleic acid binding domain-containing protein [Hymenobacter jeollabukensis]|uniref:DUF5666 domain-containing protein n=1 Tax=Hymenobacter jeollabukensis TaxID=2025313 RepID=A0A5R8WP55_9BACT|nr:OB-fold nucleic acid binding domain-containing protein [Hymenobacter jeollabukensis]TLM91835.1 hypothetical protein FDY95_14855 [Hymenobacter jeollabukensis]